MSPEKSKKSNEDYLHHPLEIIARITFLTLTLAVIWAAVIINIHNELAPAMEFNVPPSAADLDRGTDNAMDRVVRNLEDLRANQIAQQAQVEGLNYTIGFNALVLGMITAFFGALITGVIIFFAIRTRHESIAEARLAAEDKVDVSLEHHKQEFAKIEKQIERFKGLVEQHGDTISRLKEMVFADRDVEDGEGFSETEITAIESAEEKDPKDRTGADWRAIAFDLVEEGKHLDAAMAFIRARDFAGEDENKSRQWYNAGVAFGTARLPEKAIETYKDLIAWGKDSDIPGVREEVASGWVNLGATYTQEIEGWKKQPDKEIETYKDLIAWGKDSDIPGVREAVTKAETELEKLL